MKRTSIYILLIGFILSSCSVRKRLPSGETLYNGAKITVTKEGDFKPSSKNIRKQLAEITLPKKNKMILGWPYAVWAWYAIGESKNEKGFKHWLRAKFGEPPILGSTVSTDLNVNNMMGYLENNGYYRSKATGDSTVKGYKLTSHYKVKLAVPYTINAIEWKIDSSLLLTEIIKEINKPSLLISGERITLDKIKAERLRVDLLLKNNGYYYFNAGYIIAYVDTSNNHSSANIKKDSLVKDKQKNTLLHQANIYLSFKQGIPKKAKQVYTINNIVVFPNYTLLKPPPDTSLAHLIKVENIYIRDTVQKFKPFVFTKSITYWPGDKYSLTEQNKTLNRFINLGAFKFVKNRFEAATMSDTVNSINAYYYLTPLKKKTLQAEIGAFSKSNAYLGGQLNVNWLNRNIFSGAESFNIKSYFSYETVSVDSLQGNANYRVGFEARIVVPRFIVPFKIKEDNLFPPLTKFTVGYEWFRRQALYTKNFYRIQYELNWKSRVNIEHTISPISITYTKTSDFSPEYSAKIGDDKVLGLSNLPEIIVGSFYNYTRSSLLPNATNVYYFHTNLEAAGNILGLMTSAHNSYSKHLLGAYFAEYLKADLEFRYSRKLAKDIYWVNRIIVGASLPYGNSDFLPFSKQYIIGGSVSLRGFSPRSLGPGTTITNAFQRLYYPQVGGDYKLEMNTELRFPILAPFLKSAVFLDAGNIWVRDTTLYSTTGQLTSGFLKELAVDAGVGIRLDINIIIIRLDVAFPLAKPWLSEGHRWIVSDINLGSNIWRNNNLVYNIGIGYPF